jgi:hypothetical protein
LGITAVEREKDHENAKHKSEASRNSNGISHVDDDSLGRLYCPTNPVFQSREKRFSGNKPRGSHNHDEVPIRHTQSSAVADDYDRRWRGLFDRASEWAGQDYG